MSTIFRSTVKYFNMARGFGFIKGEIEGEDYFVHHTHLKDHIKEGDLVEFQVVETNRGFMAVEVRLVKTIKTSEVINTVNNFNTEIL